MAWLVGIDEAGYGPNLGPLLQAAAAVRVSDPARCLWDALSAVCAKAGERARSDDRAFVDDSKRVHAGPHGLARLERGLRAAVGCAAPSVGAFLTRHAIDPSAADLAAEPWFRPDAPLAANADDWSDAWTGASASLGGVWALATPAPRFNALLDVHSSKGDILARGLVALLGHVRATLPADGEPALVTADKLGGRNAYAAILGAAFPDAWVTVVREGAKSSAYQIVAPEREYTFVFEPRADACSWPVALASMACKWLREVLMGQFNEYWATRVPGVAPTAGYPNDAARFWRAIAPHLSAGEAERVWRRK